MTLTTADIQQWLDALGDSADTAAERLERSIRLADLLADSDVTRAACPAGRHGRPPCAGPSPKAFSTTSEVVFSMEPVSAR